MIPKVYTCDQNAPAARLSSFCPSFRLEAFEVGANLRKLLYIQIVELSKRYALA